MDGRGGISNGEHIVDIASSTDTSIAGPSPDNSLNPPAALPSSVTDGGVSRVSVDHDFWLFLELNLAVLHIVCAFVMAFLNHENSFAPLRASILCNASGCVLGLPLLYWDYYHRDQTPDRAPGFLYLDLKSRLLAESLSSSRRIGPGGEGVGQRTQAATASHPDAGISRTSRLGTLMEYFRTALQIFFGMWFVSFAVAACVSHSPVNETEAPYLFSFNLLVMLSCFSYASQFAMFGSACCFISLFTISYVVGSCRESEGTSEPINALPTYQFILQKNISGNPSDPDSSADESGLVAAGTDKERFIPGEDAVCAICLAKYEDKAALRELPCLHLFHMECVNSWLRLRATCPLCKSKVGRSVSR